MAQSTISNLDKAAVLLNRLDRKSLDRVLEMLGPDSSVKLRPILDAVSRRKDLTDLTSQVMQEFHELQHDAVAAISQSPILQQAAAGKVVATEASANPADHDSAKDSDEGSGDPVASLAKTSASVLSAALRPESPRIIATVLKQLPTDVSGKVLEAFPPELRQTVFVLLAQTSQISQGVVQSVLQKIVHVCQNMSPAAVEPQDRRLKTLIGILQSVEREERIRLMETLSEHDADLANQIDNAMYDYADLLRIEDRSVQKLLSQLEQKIVAIALKSSTEELRQKVMKNLSERVRAALSEEMELLSSLSSSKVDQARKEIANVIRTQDKEGSLVWVE